jgi:peptidoglycan/xylan/chitin deacetylase (PgdA/CDA1 family)
MIKQLVLRVARLSGLFGLARWITRNHLRVLCYHGIWLGPSPHFGDCLFMSADRFRERLAILRRHGYRVQPLAQVTRGWAPAGDGRDVVITIDDAWAGTGTQMLPALKANGFPAALYVTTENVLSGQPVWHVLVDCLLDRAQHPIDVESLLPGSPRTSLSRQQLVSALVTRLRQRPDGPEREAELGRIGSVLGVDALQLLDSRALHLMTPAELRQAHDDGFDIQLHTHTHRIPDFDPDRVRQEILANREALAAITASPVERFAHFCYPSGIYHTSLFPLLRELGIASATTTDTGLVAPGANPLAMRRVLDCESMSEIEFEAHLSGFWTMLDRGRSTARRLLGGASRPVAGRPA